MTYSRIDVSTRLRRAILLNDLLLTKRIVRNNPKWLLNPDYDDKSNTSLHLASREGFIEIVVRSAAPEIWFLQRLTCLRIV